MHIVLRSYVDDLSESFGFSVSESKLFEYFCSYCIVSKHYLGRFNPIDVTTDEDDASLDTIAVIVDGELICSIDDVNTIFSTHKTNMQVDIVIAQSKSSEQFNKSDISSFKLGVDDFLTLSPLLPNGNTNTKYLEIVKVIFNNLKKVKNKRPNLYMYYCTSGVYASEREIAASFDIIEKSVLSLDLFNDVALFPMGRKDLLKLYTSITEKNESKIKLIDYFGMPSMPGIPQSYVGICRAKDYVDSLLVNANGDLKHYIFDENVRSFLGENNVNSEIKETIINEDKKKLFSVLNNGITIVAPELTLSPNIKEINLVNYQVINGCQTSTTLFENRSHLDDQVNLVIKFIESPESDVSSAITSATNSQTAIPKESLLSLRDKTKQIQKIFNIQNKDINIENIYFERREGEYKDKEYKFTKIFDLREVARCYSAMFLGAPHNSARYVKLIFSSENEGKLFNDTDSELYYYVSVLALYKYQALINGKKIDANNYNKLRWHVIYIFKFLCHNSMEAPKPNSRKASAYAEKMIKILNTKDRHVEIFKTAQTIIDKVGKPSDDSLKRAKFTNDLTQAVKNYLENTVHDS